MIVVVSYQSDGSGMVEVQFFPMGEEVDMIQIISCITRQIGDRDRSIRIFNITDLRKVPEQIYPESEEK